MSQEAIKKLLHGTSIIGVSLFMSGVVSYLFRILLSRKLSIAEYGLFWAVFTLISLFEEIKTFGLGNGIVKFVPKFIAEKQYAKVKLLLGFIVLFYTFISGIIAMGLFFFSDALAKHYFHDETANLVIKILAVYFFFTIGDQFVKQTLYGFNKLLLFAIIEPAKKTAICILTYIGLEAGFSVIAPSLAYVLVSLVSALIFGYILYKRVLAEFSHVKMLYDKNVIKEAFRFSMPTVVTSLSFALITYADIIILTYFKGVVAVGLYNAAYPIAVLSTYISKVLNQALYPFSSELIGYKQEDHLIRTLEFIYKYFGFIMIPITLCLILFPEVIITTFFGAKYSDARIILQILAIGFLFFSFSNITLVNFMGLGNSMIITKIVLSSGLLNLILNLILVKPFGVIGVSLSTAISFFYIMVVGLFYLKKYLNIRFPYKEWLYSGLLSILFIFMVMLLKHLISLEPLYEAVIVLGVTGLMYLLGGIWLKIIRLEEIKEIIKKVGIKHHNTKSSS